MLNGINMVNTILNNTSIISYFTKSLNIDIYKYPSRNISFLKIVKIAFYF